MSQQNNIAVLPVSDIQTAPVKQITAVQLYDGKGENIESIVARIEREALSEVPDVTTAKGRKAIASNAAKVASLKTYLDGLGKDLNADLKKQAKVTDDYRKKLRDALDALKVKVRKPLTDWENKKAAFDAEVKCRMDEIKNITNNLAALTSVELRELKNKAENIVIDNSLGAYQSDAEMNKKTAVNAINEALSQKITQEAEKAELEELRKKQAAIDEQARIDKAAKDLADAKTKRLEDESLAAKQRQQDAEAETKRIKARALEEKKLAKEEAKKATQKAIEDAEEKARLAVEVEQRRVAEKAAADKKAEDERMADVKHRSKINTQALSSLVESTGLTEEQAKNVVIAIAQGKIPNVTISY